jgi:FkbM family methyltransferase
MNDKTVQMTCACMDAKDIPKVPDAGTVRIDALGNRIQIMHNGIVVLADGYCGPFMTQIIAQLKGHHEPQEEKVFHEVLKRVPDGSAMIELGANWGYYSIWFQSAVKGARNFLIEPGRDQLQCGAMNFKLNGMTGDFTRACVGRTSSSTVPSNYDIWGKDPAGPSNDSLRTVSVRDFAKSKGIESISILHSDIQGAEYDMLRGCGDLIERKKIQFVFISTHTLGLHCRCRTYLARCGYSIIAEYTQYESYTADGLVAASSEKLAPVEVSRKPVSLRRRIKTTLFRMIL